MLTPSPEHVANQPTAPTLHLLCGKIGAGKSTLAVQLAANPHTVLICEDAWLSTLYPDEIKNIAHYILFAGRLHKVMTGHISELLRAGLSVVLDFPMNTVASRHWARGIAHNTQVNHQLHFLDLPDAVCKERLHKRNQSGLHPFITSDEDFDRITHYFVAPSAEEQLNIVRYDK